jgi:archaellum component FlaC
LETSDGNKKTSFGDVEFGGERLKPRVISLVIVVEKTNSSWIPFESRISESIHLSTHQIFSEYSEIQLGELKREINRLPHST